MLWPRGCSQALLNHLERLLRLLAEHEALGLDVQGRDVLRLVLQTQVARRNGFSVGFGRHVSTGDVVEQEAALVQHGRQTVLLLVHLRVRHVLQIYHHDAPLVRVEGAVQLVLAKPDVAALPLLIGQLRALADGQVNQQGRRLHLLQRDVVFDAGVGIHLHSLVEAGRANQVGRLAYVHHLHADVPGWANVGLAQAKRIHRVLLHNLVVHRHRDLDCGNVALVWTRVGGAGREYLLHQRARGEQVVIASRLWRGRRVCRRLAGSLAGCLARTRLLRVGEECVVQVLRHVGVRRGHSLLSCCCFRGGLLRRHAHFTLQRVSLSLSLPPALLFTHNLPHHTHSLRERERAACCRRMCVCGCKHDVRRRCCGSNGTPGSGTAATAARAVAFGDVTSPGVCPCWLGDDD
eukprot:m.186120 g.186120  ORF g.186120 m.186120 type:complete len:405 (+) comp17506_c0_seq1:2940-4154(+)